MNIDTTPVRWVDPGRPKGPECLGFLHNFCVIRDSLLMDTQGVKSELGTSISQGGSMRIVSLQFGILSLLLGIGAHSPLARPPVVVDKLIAARPPVVVDKLIAARPPVVVDKRHSASS